MTNTLLRRGIEEAFIEYALRSCIKYNIKLNSPKGLYFVTKDERIIADYNAARARITVSKYEYKTAEAETVFAASQQADCSFAQIIEPKEVVR